MFYLFLSHPPLSATKTANYVASGVMSSNQLDVGNWDGSGNLKFRRLMDLERIWNTGIMLSKVFNGKVWVPLGSSCSQNITPYCPLQPLCNPGIGHICWDISGVLSQIYPTLPRVMICYVLLLLTHCHPCSMTDLSDSRPESLWLGSVSTEASYTRWWHQHILIAVTVTSFNTFQLRILENVKYLVFSWQETVDLIQEVPHLESSTTMEPQQEYLCTVVVPWEWKMFLHSCTL